jgi:hypothetical protein
VEFTWNDYSIKKGFLVLDLNNRELEFIENQKTIHEKIFYDEKTVGILTFPYQKYKNKIVAVYIKSFLKINSNQYNIFLENLSDHVYSIETKEIDAGFSEIDSSLDDSGIDISDTKKLICFYVNSVFEGNSNTNLVDISGYINSLYNSALLS